MRVTAPTFDAFYRALHDGQEPFPWQSRLAAETLADGWPDLLDLPTGVGKTSTIEIALYALALAPERMPRRTVLVVDRRIVVDQAGDHARRIAAKLGVAESGPLRTIADALRALFGGAAGDAPVEVTVMRGGMPRDNDWASRPDVPVIGISTVDQVGSRLLFRGYGLSERSRSIHAGLLGHDTLILLDEVHLSVPFAETLRAIRERYRSSNGLLPDRFRVVEMSATPGLVDPDIRSFALDDADLTSPVLARRLGARKHVETGLVKVVGKDERVKLERIAHEAVARAASLMKRGATVVAVVLNRVESARLAARKAREAFGQEVEVLLVTGRMRPLDRDRLVADRLMMRCGAGRDRAKARPTIVVATQCIEAGADLDFDAMVTECASIDAIRQRLGRVDRRGELGESHSVVLARSDSVADDADDPVYGRAIVHTWKWLDSAADPDLGVDGFGVMASATPLPPEALAPRPSAPVLLPMHLDLLSQTSPAPRHDPEVGLWLHGPERASADVQVVWRCDIALDDSPGAVSAQLAALPPSVLESVSIPIWAARRWLGTGEESEIADVEIGREHEQAKPRFPKPMELPVAFRWDGEESTLVTPRNLRPGDVLVVPADRGGLDEWGSFDVAASTPVTDLGDLAQLRARGRAKLRLGRGALSALGLSASVIGPPPELSEDQSLRDFGEAIAEWVQRWPAEPVADFPGTPDEWSELMRAIRARGRVVTAVADGFLVEAKAGRRSTRRRAGITEALTESDDGSFAGGAVPLERHSAHVRDLAVAFAERSGLASQIVNDIRLAAWFHDTGKLDPRFQRWMRGGDAPFTPGNDVALAKSLRSDSTRPQRERARSLSGYPPGYRHELLSTALISVSSVLDGAHDRDLVLHLVASHHGWCRPFAPLVDAGPAVTVDSEHGKMRLAASTRHGLARLDSGVPERFWSLTERYGWWGLAWMEAILRLADHQVSAIDGETT